MLRPHTSPPVYDDASSAFGASALTVLQMLTYASSQSGPGGSNWYGGDAGLQALVKKALQAVNTRQAFPSP